MLLPARIAIAGRIERARYPPVLRPEGDIGAPASSYICAFQHIPRCSGETNARFRGSAKALRPSHAKVPLGQSAAHGLLGANQLVVIKTDHVAV